MDTPDISPNALREDLQKALNNGRSEGAGSSIYQSIMTSSDRLRYANTRLLGIERVIQEKVAPNFEEWRDLGPSDESDPDFHQSQWEIRMLATEAVQHLHSVFDPLACAIYWFDVPAAKQKMTPRDLSFYKVRKCESVNPKYREVLSAMDSADSFYHLAALCNLAKHSRIVRPNLLHFSKDGYPLDAESAVIFEHCRGPNWLNKAHARPIETTFPSTPISKFLRDEFKRVEPLFNTLVQFIRSDLDSRLKNQQQ